MMVHRGQSSLVTRPTPPVIVWMVLVAVLLALSLTADAALTLKVGSLSETSGPEQASYYSLGLSAAASVASSAALTYSVVPSSVGVSDGFSTIQAFSAAQVIGTLGPAATDLLNSMCMNPSFATIEYVTFAPLVQGIDNTNGVDPTFLLYRTQVYFTIPSDQVQSVALLMLFAKRDLFPINQKLLRNSGSGIGGSPNLMLNIIATNMGVSYTFLSMNSFSTNAVVSFFGSNPKVIYFFGDATKTATSLWFSALCTSSNAITLNTSISFPMDIEYQFLQLYITEKTNGQKTLPVENFVVSVSHPGIDSTEYAVSHQFMEEAQDLLPANANTCILNYVMSGWLNARAFLASISQYAGSTVSPANYYKNLLQGQSSFVVSDLFVGSFGVNCSEVAVRQGAICGCHHGGNHVFFHQFVQRGAAYDVATIPNSMYQYALGMCANVIPTGDVLPATPFQTQLTYPSPIHVVGLNTPDNDMILYMCDQFQSVISQLENHTLYWHTSTHDYRAYCLKTTVSNAQTALQTHYADYITFGLMGVIPDALLTTSYVTGSLIVDVIPQTTRPALSEKNLIYICPTLEQELSVLASQVQQVSLESSVTVCGVVSQSTVSTSIISLLQALLTTMLVPVVSTNFVTSNTGAAMTASIKAGCTHTFLIGISSTDVTSTEAYLTANPKAFLYVSFDDLTKLYESFQAQYTSSNTVTDRLIFATNLPSWTSPAYSSTASVTNTAVSSIDQFLQTVPDKLHTPAAVRSFVSAMVMDAAMTQKTPTNSLPDAITALYSMSMVSAGGMMFGPFGQQCLTATDNACVQNYGARDISVWSFTRVLQPLTDVLLEPSTPSPFILSPASHSLAERGDEHASATTDMTGVAAADIDCIMRSESSGSQPNSQHADSTASSSSSAVPPVPLPTDHLSSSDASLQSSESTALDVLMYILAALCGLCVLLLVLLLVCRYCPLRCCCQWTCFTSLRRARTYPEVEERPETQSLADFGPEFSIVVIDVVRWKAEWSRNPVKMTDLVHAYETIVRAAVMHYGCFEAAHVCGFYTLLCPSPTVAVELAYHTHRCLEELRLPSVHDEAPSRLFRVGMHVLTHTATTSKEAGLSEAQMIALRVGYAGCGDSVMLSAAAFEALPQHLRDGLRVSEAGFYHADPGKPESSPTNRVFAVNVSGDVEGVASVLSCAYPAFVMKHDRECYFINSATLCEDQLGRFFIAVPILEQLITLKYSCHYFRVGSPARGGLSDTQLIRELTVILCQRLGSLLEYRHSICAPMSNIHRPGVAESRSLAQPEFDESGTSVRSIRRKQHQRYQSRHTLRHFSYQREAEE